MNIPSERHLSEQQRDEKMIEALVAPTIIEIVNGSDLTHLDLSNPEHQKKALERMEPLSSERIVYTKPLAIVINPNSGKKRDLRKVISQRLDEASVPHEFLVSTK